VGVGRNAQFYARAARCHLALPASAFSDEEAAACRGFGHSFAPYWC
jgi:hypothetical protein